MMLKPDQERVRTLLKDTITLLCRNGLSFNAKFCIDAVIGVTLDDRELFYMSMNEVIKSEKAQLAEQEANNEEESEVDEGSHKRRLGKEPRKRHKNKRPRIKNEEGGSSSEEERLESVTHEDDDESYTGSGNFQAEGGVDDASSDPQNSLMMGVKREQDKDDDENNDIVFIKEEMDDNWGPSGSNNTSTSQGSFFQGVPGSSNQDSGMFQSGDNQQEQSFGSLSDMNLVPVGSQEGAMMWAQSTSSTQYQGVGRGRGRGRSSMGVTSQGDSSTQPGLDQQATGADGQSPSETDLYIRKIILLHPGIFVCNRSVKKLSEDKDKPLLQEKLSKVLYGMEAHRLGIRLITSKRSPFFVKKFPLSKDQLDPYGITEDQYLNACSQVDVMLSEQQRLLFEEAYTAYVGGTTALKNAV